MTKRLSVIIPVFNGEKFIAECLDSLISQIFDEVEVIVINDGSTDQTDHIITSRYAAEITCKQLIYRNTQNGGVSAARNIGLDIARGDYIAFVDADDTVTKTYVPVLLDAIRKAPCIIELGYRNIDQQGVLIKDNCFIHTQFGMHVASQILDRVFAACLWYPVLRVVKRELFTDAYFPVGVRFCEDLITLSGIYKKAKNILSLSDVVYSYRLNPDGATLNIKLDYMPPLVDYYRKILVDNSFSNKALKINLAYVIRRCTVATTDVLGRVAPDIESDLRKLIFTPRLFFCVRARFVIYALFGPVLCYLKKIVR
jgi:glycosyltransferase involved in cell wall biosynthesis